jgi:hypothetical protein
VVMRLFTRENLLRLAICAITLLVFSRLVECDFTWWDDGGTIHHNPQLKSPGFYWTAIGVHAPMQLYIPVTYTFWSGISRLAALPRPDADGIVLNPHVFHAASVVLHALTALLVFELLLQLIRNPWAAVVGALLFALHPVQVESVAWISGTKDELCGMFSVAALLEYVRFAVGKRAQLHYATATLFLILAMLSKPTAIVVPLMAGSIDLLLLRRSWRKTVVSLLPWLVLMIPLAALTRISQPTTLLSPLPAWMSPGIAGDAVAFYLYKLAIPLRMAVDYGRRPQAVLAHGWIYYTWLLPAVLFILLFLNRRRWPFGFTAALLFILPLVPVLGFMPFMFQEVSTTADHYLYLAMLGPALFAACIVARFPGRMTACLATIALLFLTFQTAALEPVWQNTRTLFEHALKVNPDSFVACDMLGFDHAREARLHWNDPPRSRAQLEIAAGYYIRALDINPRYVPSLFNLAIVFQESGQEENARRAIRRIADLQTSLPPGLRTDPVIIAEKLVSFGAYSDALRWLDRILLSDPENEKALKLRRRALAATRPAEG